jgi:hypothetical protein
MGQVWVLDTETKGTGANVVPLEKVLQKRSSPLDHLFVPPKRRPRPAPAPEPRLPRRFKVIDVMTRQPLVYDASARDTVDVLRDVRSIVDVNVYVWESKRSDWRLLTLAEQRMIWNARDVGRRLIAATTD